MRFTNNNINKNSYPFFSIITVVKNDEKNIISTLKSIKNQTFTNFEHIIIDGNSSDQTLNKINIYRKSIDKIISEKDQGIYFAMNKGLKLSRGKIIVFINSGDIITKKALEVVYKKFYEKNLDFLFGTVKRNYTKMSILKYGYNLKKMKYNFDFATSHSTGFFLKKKYYKKLNYFNTEYKCSADYDFYFRLFLHAKKIKGDNTLKNQIIGKVAAGGFSSQYGYLRTLTEECRIRINNRQNKILVLVIFLNNLFKKIFKDTFNVFNSNEINQKNSKFKILEKIFD